jgi:hypothetical protein
VSWAAGATETMQRNEEESECQFLAEEETAAVICFIYLSTTYITKFCMYLFSKLFFF